MKKIILCVLLSLFSGLTLAEIKVQIEPSQVSVGDTFILTLSQDNAQSGGVPDLTVLQSDFTILGTERTMNYTVINGQAQSTNQWVISLRAVKAGIFTIPAIKIGTEQTNPVTMNVEASSTDQKSEPDSQQQDVVLNTQIDETKPYVNQQIIYTVKLYTRKRLLDIDFQGPQAENALVVSLGDARRYQTVKDTINYIVEEQSYAIFPQKSGKLTIESPTFSAVIYDIDSQRIKLSNKPIPLTVQAVPSQYKGKLWLPAKQVTLSEHYENPKQSLSQGSTLTRTITLEAVAIPAQLLPKLSFNQDDNYNVYPEKGIDKNQIKQGDLIGSTVIKVTYLFNKAGKITLPELRIPWFNTTTGKDEVAVLAPRSMDITPSPVPTTKNTPSEQSSPKSTVNEPLPIKDTVMQTSNNWAWIVASSFASAWVITLALWAGQRRPKHSGSTQYKNALAKLKKACSECNPQKAREALLLWGSLHWPDAPILNLTDLTQLVKEAPLKKQLNILSQSLYGNKVQTWRGEELWRAVHAYATKRAHSDKKADANILPPINPA